jgi:hypothetical protein
MEAFNEKKFIEILRGQFDKLPKDRSKIVRIFLSSTFSGISVFIINYQKFFKNLFSFRYSFRKRSLN